MPVVGFPLLLCHRSLFVGKLSLWGRLSSRPWSRLPAASAQPNAVGAHQCVRPPWSAPPALPHRMFAWSMPPGLPCRRSRRQSDTIPTCAGAPNAIQPATLPTPPQAAAPQCGASRQACHAGGHAGRATQSRAVREFQSPTAAKTGGVARTTARSTSTRRFPSHLRVLRVLCGLLFCVSSVSSVVCFSRALPTPSHNLSQIFFPFLFNHLPTPLSSPLAPLLYVESERCG